MTARRHARPAAPPSGAAASRVGVLAMNVPDPLAQGLPTLDGPRVRLRAMTAADAPALIPIYGDPEVRRLGYAPPMGGLDDARAVVDETLRLAREGTLFHWGLALREDDAVVGHCTLFHLDRRHGRAEVGYSLRRDLWGRGIVTEALGVLIGFAFDGVGLRRLEADADPRNAGSLRVLEKHGFVREGFMRERWCQEGEIQDAVVLGLLRREWTGCTPVAR
jgi:RimJ/RimL family protein N-acetyltransferase